jgi:hypothetical protein
MDQRVFLNTLDSSRPLGPLILALTEPQDIDTAPLQGPSFTADMPFRTI